MSYAGNRVIYDADGHIMELPTHLREFADPDVRELIPLTSYSASSVTEEEVAVLVGQGGKHSNGISLAIGCVRPKHLWRDECGQNSHWREPQQTNDDGRQGAIAD